MGGVARQLRNMCAGIAREQKTARKGPGPEIHSCSGARQSAPGSQRTEMLPVLLRDASRAPAGCRAARRSADSEGACVCLWRTARSKVCSAVLLPLPPAGWLARCVACCVLHQLLLSPCAYRLALPVLYCVTFMVMCFLQPLQNAFLVFGTFTCLVVIGGGGGDHVVIVCVDDGVSSFCGCWHRRRRRRDMRPAPRLACCVGAVAALLFLLLCCLLRADGC